MERITKVITKVICISKENGFVEGDQHLNLATHRYMYSLYNRLEVGKLYYSINFSSLSDFCGILNGDGRCINDYDVYLRSNFMSLKEYRKCKLNKLSCGHECIPINELRKEKLERIKNG
jgi:hypothetical protein